MQKSKEKWSIRKRRGVQPSKTRIQTSVKTPRSTGISSLPIRWMLSSTLRIILIVNPWHPLIRCLKYQWTKEQPKEIRVIMSLLSYRKKTPVKLNLFWARNHCLPDPKNKSRRKKSWVRIRWSKSTRELTSRSSKGWAWDTNPKSQRNQLGSKISTTTPCFRGSGVARILGRSTNIAVSSSKMRSGNQT